jgi:hypothetical protein
VEEAPRQDFRRFALVGPGIFRVVQSDGTLLFRTVWQPFVLSAPKRFVIFPGRLVIVGVRAFLVRASALSESHVIGLSWKRRASDIAPCHGSWSVVRAVSAGMFLFAVTILSASAEETLLDSSPFEDDARDWRTLELFTGQAITFYGEISPIVLQYDDGVVSRTYAPLGNSNKTSRLGFRWQIRNFGGWAPVARVEMGLSERPAKEVNLLEPGSGGWSIKDGDLRKLELILRHPGIGAFSVGQGSMATHGITEVDYSGTDVAAKSNVGRIVASQLLRNTDGTLSTLEVGQFVDNFDGSNITGTYSDGSRKLRLRYDSLSFRGFAVSVAVGNEVLREDAGSNADAALTYEADVGDYMLAAGLGYSWQSESRVLSGSASVLHQSTGFNLTAAMGRERDGGNFSYLKAGVLRRIWSVGDSALTLDFYRGNDILSGGSMAASYGLAFVQSFDRFNLQGFALVRSFDFKEPGASYENSLTMMTGLRWAF